MVVIRLARGGAKKQPFYHVVVADKRNARDGKYIENVGYFNPVARGQAVRLKLNKEAIETWIGKGAQPSDRVKSLVKEFNGQSEPEITAANREKTRRAIAKEKKAEAKKKEQENAAKAAAEAAAKEEAEAAAASAAEADSGDADAAESEA